MNIPISGTESLFYLLCLVGGVEIIALVCVVILDFINGAKK